MRMLLLPVAVAIAAAFVTLSAQTRKASPPAAASRTPFTVVEATIPEMRAAMEQHRITSKELVRQYLMRIGTYEDRLHAAITVNPNALAIADERDRERAQGRLRGPLHGIPVALKDNIQTTDMRTTGGALAFESLVPPYEATITTEPQGRGRHHHRQDDVDRAGQLGGGRADADARQLQRSQRSGIQSLRSAQGSARGDVRRPRRPEHRRFELGRRARRRTSGRRTSAPRRRARS